MGIAPQGSDPGRPSAADLSRSGDHNNRGSEKWFLVVRHSFTHYVASVEFQRHMLPCGVWLVRRHAERAAPKDGAQARGGKLMPVRIAVVAGGVDLRGLNRTIRIHLHVNLHGHCLESIHSKVHDPIPYDLLSNGSLFLVGELCISCFTSGWCGLIGNRGPSRFLSATGAIDQDSEQRQAAAHQYPNIWRALNTKVISAQAWY